MPIGVNPADYEDLLSTFDLTEDEKAGLLEALARVAMHFIDRAFDAPNACGQLPQIGTGSGFHDVSLVKSFSSATHQQVRAPSQAADRKGGSS